MNSQSNNEISAVERWVDEIVIGLNLCPFSIKPRRNKQIRFQISEAQNPEQLLTDLHTEISLLAETSASKIETSLLIVTKMLSDFDSYNQFLDQADQLLIRFEWDGIFQIASFHPDYCFADTEPDAADNLSNRSPYPILHILREDSIEKALENITSPDQIYTQNIKTLQQLSIEQIRHLFSFQK